MNDLMIFNNNEFGQVRTLEIDGQNFVNPQNNKEVQPLYYESKFKDLLKLVSLL